MCVDQTVFLFSGVDDSGPGCSRSWRWCALRLNATRSLRYAGERWWKILYINVVTLKVIRNWTTIKQTNNKPLLLTATITKSNSHKNNIQKQNKEVAMHSVHSGCSVLQWYTNYASLWYYAAGHSRCTWPLAVCSTDLPILYTRIEVV